MEYQKIETLYERSEQTHRLLPELILKNRVYGIVNPWRWTEKVDGTNIRVIWSPLFAQCGHSIAASDQKFCAQCGAAVESTLSEGKVTFGGKTDNAQVHAGLSSWLYENITAERLQAVFPTDRAVIYGEGYGAGIQKSGGDYSPTKKLIVFDVLVADQWWLSQENVEDVARKLGLDVVPDFGEMTLAEATEMVRAGFQSRCSVNPRPAEGLVGRPIEALFDKKGHRLIVKLKTKDF